MRYLDVCAGISASTVAWKPLGWEAAAYSEIEAAPRAILAHHYPTVPLHGDFTTIKGDEYGPIDLLVGGTPCQDFSIAGLRAGLAGDRGNLSLQFLLLARRTGARWVVWENVPGVFSSLSHDAPDPRPPAIDLDAGDGPEDGEEIVVSDSYDADESHAFASFLAGLSELGYGVAYRVLDAQHFGVPQRRRRVFVVGYLGDRRRAAAVLFERHSLSGHPAPRRKSREAAPGYACIGIGEYGPGVGSLRAKGADVGGGSETLIPIAFDCTAGGETGFAIGEIAGALRVGGRNVGHAAVAFDMRGREGGAQFEGPHDAANLRAASDGSSRSYVAASAVRRLTPRECERLQGFPDDYTLVPHRGKPMADGPRYKALGNSMAVPVMRWLGERIAQVDALDHQEHP